jgi:hypothetical protein
MSTADAAWLHTNPTTNLMIATTVLWFDEPVDWARCRAVFGERSVARFDRFRQGAVEGPPLAAHRWEEDPEFDSSRTSTTWRCPLRTTAARGRSSSATASSCRSTGAGRCGRSTSSTTTGLLRDGAADRPTAFADGIALARVMLALTDGGEPDAGVAPAQGRPGRGLVGVIEPVARAVGAVAHEGVETLLRPGHAAELAAAVIDDGQRSPSRR